MTSTTLSTSVPTQRATRVRYVVVAFLCMLAFLTYFDRICIVSAEKPMERDLGISPEQWALILGGFWLAYGLFEIPGGWLGDRFGSRRALSGVALVWSLFTALSGSAVGFISLYTSRFLFGAGEAGAYPNMARVQSRWIPLASQGRVGGVLWMVSRWGGALSYVLFPALLAAIESYHVRLAALPGLHALSAVPSWRIGFWVCGIAGLIWVLLFYPWFRDDPDEQRWVNREEVNLIRAGRPAGDSHGHARLDSRTAKKLFSSPSLWGITLAYTCGSFGWSFFVSWMKPYLDEQFPHSSQNSLWLKTLPLLFGGAACVLGGWLSDRLIRATGRERFGRAIFPVCGFGLAAISMACIPFARTPIEAVTLMCLGSFGNDIGQAAEWASIISISGRFAGTAFGLVNMFANVFGNSLQPSIGESMHRHYGWAPVFALYGSVYLVACVTWLFVNPARTFDSET